MIAGIIHLVKKNTRKSEKAALIFKISRIVLILILFTFRADQPLFSADLDEIYKPLLKEDQTLYRTGSHYFGMYEKGVHGGASFDAFNSFPHFSSLHNAMKFSPISNVNMEVGYGQAFPVSYERPTHNPSGAVTSLQKYKLDYFQDYTFNLRVRREQTEVYLDFLEKRQMSNWTFTTDPDNTPTFFNYFHSHYEDIKIGIRSLTEHQTSVDRSNLDFLHRPLLEDNQSNIETELAYKNGRLDRSGVFYLANTLDYNYVHSARPHLIPKIIWRYGVNKNLEMESGLSYTAPFKYAYEYKLYSTAGTSNFITGTYKLKNNFSIPLKFRYRPKDNFEILFSSSFRYIRQSLDYWEKETDDSTTIFPSKELGYFQTKPTLKLTYFSGADKQISNNPFSSLVKNLLLKKQFSIEFQFQKDITSLKKGGTNGTQNIVDPYNVFLYPVDFFVVGSGYAAFFSGNTATTPANVSPQNYYSIDTNFIYGLKDTLNVGLGAGYRSGSAVHQFSLNDLGNRFFRFKPYYYIDLLTDWKVGKDGLLSFKVHFVPQYKTLLESSAHPQDFRAETRYIEASLSYQILF